jgi:hypothetical protein
MFKYISEILAQFSRPQKILALLLVLFSVMTISIAPSLISALTVDCEELKLQVERQNKRIFSLESLVDTLDTKIRSNQRECTNEISSREEEFLKMLDDLKSEIRITETRTRVLKMESYETDSISGTRRITQVKPEVSMKPVLSKIDQMKCKIKDRN